MSDTLHTPSHPSSTAMAGIALERATRRFPDGTVAVRELTLSAGEGELLVLVGPSGSGKTSVLRMVAGLDDVTSGKITIGGRVVNDLAPRDRDIAMVFQSYALYPHLNVFENMAFALRVRKLPAIEIRRRVDSVAAQLGITDLLDRRPSQLSGGQRQRVAMGRAIVRKPAAFLMDEPLSNLDARLRAEMRTEIVSLHRRLGTTTLYVTHDQTEAMTMGDRVAVLRSGLLQQVDSPRVLYDRPRNRFVAEFMGSPPMNCARARLERDSGSSERVVAVLGCHRIEIPPTVFAERRALGRFAGHDVIVGIRPEDMEDGACMRDLRHAAGGPDAGAPRFLEATVTHTEPLGAEVIVHFPIDPDGTAMFTARLDRRSRATAGERITLGLDANRLHFFEPESGDVIA